MYIKLLEVLAKIVAWLTNRQDTYLQKKQNQYQEVAQRCRTFYQWGPKYRQFGYALFEAFFEIPTQKYLKSTIKRKEKLFTKITEDIEKHHLNREHENKYLQYLKSRLFRNESD